MTISVVIPTYNGGRYIEQAILSALGQERQPDEIVVCDDHSSDDTLEICGKYRDRITIVANEHGPSGFVNGWNRAIGFGRGDYICILHQDDVLAPEFIRVGMEALEREPGVRHLFCVCKYIDEGGNELGFSYEEGGERIRRYSGRDYFFAYQVAGEPHIHRCPGVITHRSVFDHCRYEVAAGHIADDDFFYRVGMFTDVIGIMRPLASFRIHGGSVTGGLEDTVLAGRLMDDYMYQCRQWRGHPFAGEAGYSFFIRNARKYSRRCIGYGIRQKKMGMVVKGIMGWVRVRHLC